MSMEPAAVTHCPACGASADNARIYRFNSAHKVDERWAKCPACGSFYNHEVWKMEEAVASSNLEGLNHPDHWKRLLEFKSKIYSAVVARVAKYAPPPASLLDTGCSYGGVLLKAKALGYRCTGVDIVKQALDSLETQGIETHLSATVATLNPSRQFDAITAIDMNMYWPDQPSELDAISHRLKPGGCLVFRIVDKSWMVRIGLWLRNIAPSVGNRLISRSINNHRFSMPTSSFVALLESKGYTIKERSLSDAIISDRSSAGVKAMFLLARLLRAVTGNYYAPGLLIVAQKNKI